LSPCCRPPPWCPPPFPYTTLFRSDAAAEGGADAAAEKPKVSRETVLTLLRSRSFLGFMVLMFGAAALYDVFDQQFPNYFARFVTGAIDPQVLFSRVVFVQILVEALVMVAMPFVIHRIGAKRGLSCSRSCSWCGWSARPSSPTPICCSSGGCAPRSRCR